MSAAPAFHAFAHRGGRAHGADNTLPAFEEALRRGAPGLETDAWLTADGAVVLDHDGVYRTAKRRHKPMAQVRRDELPAHVPTLDAVYAACGTDFDLAIDVRVPEIAAAVIEVARRYGATSRLWLVGESPEMLRAWRALEHGGHLVLSVRLVERRMSVVRAAQQAGAEALNMRWPWWTRSFVRNVHDAGLLAFGYDVQRTWTMRHCLRLGLDGIFSDHVDRMSALLARQVR